MLANSSQKIGQHILLLAIGALTGITCQLDWWALTGRFVSFQNASVLMQLLSAALIVSATLFGLRWVIRRGVRILLVPASVKTVYEKYDTLTYSVFLLPLVGAAGIGLSIPFLYMLGFTFVAAQAALGFTLLKNSEEGSRFFESLGWISVLFLISGASALIYQVVWQRVLFASYGVNIESVTVIVSIFMFGLGAGSLLGGLLSKRFPSQLPELFLLCE